MDGCGSRDICYDGSECEDKHAHGREGKSTTGVYMGYAA